MAEEIKRRRGRPRKEETGKKSENWGGKREGAGRPKTKENPKDTMLPFRVSAITARRIKQLRELTKEDAMPFVDMLEDWVRELAEDYGVE